MHTQNKRAELESSELIDARMEELVKAGMFRWPTQRVLKMQGAKSAAAASSRPCPRPPLFCFGSVRQLVNCKEVISAGDGDLFISQ